MKHKCIRIFLLVTIILYFIIVPVSAEEVPDELNALYAQSAVLLDADSGRILFGKNEEQVLAMASTTKIMTCILALENMTDQQICVVSDEAAKQPKVHLGVRSGEQFYLKDLLYSLMLESHNDSAVIIAETIGGSVKDFAAMMNAKAKRIGCNDTYFITPNGLDAEDDTGKHSTTATDLARIMRYCIRDSVKSKEFIEITKTEHHTFTDVEGKRQFSCHNHNAFLGMMEGALSGKTGFTNDAGYCYVGALQRGERTFIVALLACGWPNNKSYKWKDTRRLMEYAISNYEYENVYQEWKDIEIEVVNGADKEKLKAGLNEQKEELLALKRKDEKVTITTDVEDILYAPVSANRTVGYVTYSIDGTELNKYPVVTKESVIERTFLWCLEQNTKKYLFYK